MATLTGVHLLPSTGEFTYDTIAFSARRSGAAMAPINTYNAPGGVKTDYSYSIDQLQAAHPECRTVAVVCAWFCNGLTAGQCQIFPSTTYIGGAFQRNEGGADHWRVSGLTESSPGLIALPISGDGTFVYGGTPSDASIVRCIQDLRLRGFNVIFYPFLLMTAPGLPWRGLIGFTPDVTIEATAAINSFLGNATASQFNRDAINSTVAYNGDVTNYSYRRMILHYANLCVVSGGVSLFVLGSELRGLETVRGPVWTKSGTTDAFGHAVWDYPFVFGLAQLAADVRAIFDGAGMVKDTGEKRNLVTYSADWSDWMGYQHPGADGQWPHLDSLYASADIDLVAFDNYLPLSDWTTGDGGLDAANWREAPPTKWPVEAPDARGLGLSGAPTIYSSPYLQANIEGGEKFDWYYNNGVNGGPEFDPRGSGLVVSQAQGDRATQKRNAYSAGQQILANKQLRWWWRNSHFALYDTGSGWVSRGPSSAWAPQSKPIIFLEYGIPAVDKGSNQPNLFFTRNSVASGTPYWSIWDAGAGETLMPRRDDTIAELSAQAVYDYWQTRNALSGSGVAMIDWTFCCVWNWDARPFPTFPRLDGVWGDAGNWDVGNWLNGRGPATPPVAATPTPLPGAYPSFPMLTTLGWSTHVRPTFSTSVAVHVAGPETRRAARGLATYELELRYPLLRADGRHQEFQSIVAFFEETSGQTGAFWLAPPGLASIVGQNLGRGDGIATEFSLVRSFGGYSEPTLATGGVSAVYLNDVFQASGWRVTAGLSPRIAFDQSPASGVTVTADFVALWLCRFAEDTADFENFMSLLWSFGSVKLKTVRP